MIISVDAEKAFDKIYCFMIKNDHEFCTEGTCLNIIKATCDKPTDNIVVLKESFSVFYVVLEALARVIR